MHQNRRLISSGSVSFSTLHAGRALSQLVPVRPRGIQIRGNTLPLRALLRLPRAALIYPVLLSCISFTIIACSGKKPAQEYAAVLEAAATEYRAFAAETADITIKAANRGTSAWKSEGPKSFHLSYHLLDDQGNVLRFDNERFPFPGEVRPGQNIEMTIKVKAPLDEGRYRLDFDCLQEGVTWFKDRGSKTLSISLVVERRDWPEDRNSISLEAGPFTKFRGGPPEFDRLFQLIRITLKHDETEFQGKTGKIKGFAAGSGYPQVWLRDSRTIIPASCLFYPQEYLASWLEEHLAFQKENGSLDDWVDFKGGTDKNTTETDQEASAVQSASDIARLLGPEWPAKKIAGRSILDRLESALSFVLKERFDRKTGLVKGAHTADWGDVDMEDADQQAIYTDSRTNWTADIYDQSMFFESALDLAAMMVSVGRKDRAAFWQGKAEAVRRNTNARLWQENRGFYRVHIHLNGLRHEFDEDDIFAMGGNTLAIISGMAGDERARRIIEQALKRQSDFALSTLGGALLPPYPKGFFRHPSMDDPYEYQNGGQWDWFGGRLIRAMFDHGFGLEARDKLLEIARKNIKNNGLFEWDSPEGRGRGSDFYAGSAGALAGALFEGYFGIRLSRNGLSLEPKLGKDNASVHLNLPAAGLFAAYEYKYFPDDNKITFIFNSNFPGNGDVKILLPRDWIPEPNTSGSGSNPPRVLKDGARTDFALVRNHLDTYVVLKTDFKHRLIEIRKER
jgi:hypothetical protein